MVVTTAHLSHRVPFGTLGGERFRRDELGPFNRKDEGGNVLITFAANMLPVTPVIVSRRKKILVLDSSNFGYDQKIDQNLELRIKIKLQSKKV